MSKAIPLMVLNRAAGDDMRAFLADGKRSKRNVSDRDLRAAVAATVPDWTDVGLLPPNPSAVEVEEVVRKTKGHCLIMWFRVMEPQLRAVQTPHEHDRVARIIRFIEDMSGASYSTWSELGL